MKLFNKKGEEIPMPAKAPKNARIEKAGEYLTLVAGYLLGLNIGIIILEDKVVNPIYFVLLSTIGAFAPTAFKAIRKKLKGGKK